MGNVWEHSMTDLPWATIWEMNTNGNCIPHPFAFTIYLLYQNSGKRYRGSCGKGGMVAVTTTGSQMGRVT